MSPTRRATAVALVALLAVVVVSAKSGTEPTQVHQHIVGDEWSRVVTWSTREAAATFLDLLPSGPRVEGTSFEFKDGNGYASVIHNVVLKDLKPGLSYSYVVGSPDGGWSRPFNLSVSTVRRWAVYGDFGLENDQSLNALLLAAKNRSIQGVVHAGDFAYDLHTDNGTVGDGFLGAIEPLSAQMPYQVVPGNHEEAGNFTHYRNRFSGVALGASRTALWHSWDSGLVHFVGIDTEAYVYWQDAGQQQRQMAWLRDDLKAAAENRATVPWIVMFGHKTDFMLGAFNATFGQLANEFDVDLLLAGHIHNYERYWPYYGQKSVQTYLNPPFMTTIVVGSPGCREKIASGDKGEFLAAKSESYGFGELEAMNRTHLSWKWIQTAEDDGKQTSTPRVLDQIVLVRQH